MANRRLLILLPLALAVGARPLAAQNPECSLYALVDEQAGRVCNAAVDGARAFHPIVGLLTSGGNPVLGRAGSLGGLGRFAITARVNATNVVLPDLDYDGSTGVVAKDDELFFPSPLVEGAVGLVGGRGLVGLDLLASAQLLPTGVVDGLEVDPDATNIGSVALGFGFGARVSLFGHAGPLPGVSVSLMRRSIPRVAYGDLTSGDDYAYAADVQAWNLRAVAGRRFSVLTVAGGLGHDWYDGDASASFREPFTGIVIRQDVELNTSRTMLFADAGVDFNHVRIVAEAGYQFGKDQNIGTVFQDFDPSSGRFFAAAGLQFGL
jgi:hypothetical protein